jgi:hypothetical protein
LARSVEVMRTAAVATTVTGVARLWLVREALPHPFPLWPPERRPRVFPVREMRHTFPPGRLTPQLRGAVSR